MIIEKLNGEVMGTLNKLIITGCMLFACTQTYAVSKTMEFTADAVVSIPQQPVKETKLFVSKKAVRSETSIGGQKIIEIIYSDEGKAILINEPLKSYKERMFPVQKNINDSSNPCDQIQNAVCEKLGTEKIDGLKTEKWQIISNNRGRKLRTLHWVDVKRKLALREFFPDGSVAELKMLKKEKTNGRNAEKWQRTLSRPDGSVTKSYQWYDAGLKISIKEELPGGYVRELKNIKIGKQPKELFKVPEDYRKIEMTPAVYPEYMNR
ncbi:MAG: DUF4412 domain-containing protein [Gammaproteobacteria bacterium]|nr:DUF4412 domain-containing protein [Gammaproteobacteria bacterium]